MTKKGVSTPIRFLALKTNECATVQSVNGSKRLADLGFVHGVEITMIQPGSPCIIKINGRYFGLGNDHQHAIQITKEDTS